MTFRVLRPVYFPVPGLEGVWRTNWKCVGTADSMEEAREVFGGRPVLEHIGPHQPIHYVEEGRA